MATKVYKPKRKISATESEEIKIPASSVDGLKTVATSGSYNDLSDKPTIPDVSGLMPKSGGTFTGEVKFGSTENFQGYYIKRMLGYLGIGTAYANLPASYKDGTWHRMWRLRFPSGSNFWGKIKITLYGNYSSFNASGVMSKSITCNFNTSNIYNNVGCYDGLGVNVEQDFRISEAIWNATASAWEILIWQQHLNGNNSPVIMLECWTTNNTNYINAFNGITAQTVELTQSTSYSAQKASSTGGTKTVEWATLPVYENPLGEEIATMSDLSNKANLSGGNTFTGDQTVQDSQLTVVRDSSQGGGYIFDTYDGNGDANSGTILGVYQTGKDAGRVIIGEDSTAELTVGGDAGTAGQVLTSQGAGKTPIWGDITKHGYTQLTNENLNTITEAGWYNAASGNSCTNRPTNVGTSPFILEVEKCTSAEMRQTLYTRYWTNGFYIRTSTNSGSSWTSWQSQYTVDTGAQVFSGRKSFSGGINLTSSLQVGGSSGTAGQVLTSTGTGAPQWTTPSSGGGSSNVIVDRPMIQGVEYTVFDSGEYGSFIGTFSLETQDSSITITVGNADYIITNNDWVHCRITIDKNNDFMYSTIAINTGNVNRTWSFSTLPSDGAVKISTDLTSSYMEHSICVIMKEVI